MSAVTQYFQNIRHTLSSSLEGMAVTMSWLFRKPMTIQYPYRKSAPHIPVGGPDSLFDRYRGFLEVDMDICSACLACERACPIECIRIQVDKIPPPDNPQGEPVRAMTRFDIDLGKCMYCGLCSEPCPTGAIRHTKHFEGTVTDPTRMVAHFIEPGRPVLPFKVKKGETPPTQPLGSIAKRWVVDRSWNEGAAQ